MLCSNVYAQSVVTGTIIDEATGEALPYCSVAIKNHQKGTFTNNEGQFKLQVNDIQRDTLIISFIGYSSKSIPAIAFAKTHTVYLKRVDNIMPDLVVRASDSYLYKIVEQCRKKIVHDAVHEAKAYIELETEKEATPVEFLQSYNNATVTNGSITSLEMKMGKVALATPDSSGFFVSFDIAKAMGMVKLTQKNNYLPFVPFQFKGKKLQKTYWLKALPSTQNTHHIAFYPKTDSTKYFKGEMWIDKASNQLIKIVMHANNTSVFPFVSLVGDTLEHVNLEISKTYDGIKPSIVNFSYTFDYKSSQSNPTQRISNTSYHVKSNGVIMLYSYDNTFILPYYNFVDGYSDYRKISFLPFSAQFWENESGLTITEQQKEKLDYFKQNGINFNFISDYIKTSNHKFFESNNAYWSNKNRIILKKHLLHDSLIATNSALNFRSNLYNLNVQILLVVNEIENRLECSSHTVFDVFQTYFNLPEELATNCFINIYFDICEIERRKMEERIASLKNKKEADALYNEVKKNLEDVSNRYFKEVQTGKNLKELKKWNNYVKDNLGVDNFEIFGL